MLIEEVGYSKNVDWDFIFKDAFTLMSMISDVFDYVPDLDVKYWQIRNIDYIEDSDLREEILQTRLVRQFSSKKIQCL